MKQLSEVMMIAISFLVIFLLGCGVKGDPLPPERPAEIGRGEPTYKRASEDLSFKSLPPVEDLEEDEDDEDEDEDEDEE